MIRTVEVNVQHVFEVVDDVTKEVLYRDAVFYPKAIFEKKTQEDLDADGLARYVASQQQPPSPVDPYPLSAEEQKAQSVASLKNTIRTLSDEVLTLASKAEAL